jgi:hypothetical protein
MLQLTIDVKINFTSNSSLQLSQIGSSQQFCNSWSLNQTTFIQSIDVNYDQNYIRSVQFNTF